ncbi:MAG TPA: hypothetical protein VGL56_02285 [Fimbriimonadaceae bacterium]
MGNLIPALFAVPFALFGLWWMSSKGQIMGPGFIIFAISPIVGWFAMNFFGLYQNRAMKRSIARFLRGVRPKVCEPMYFVGIATPKYASLLDPHEDIGFLILHDDRLEFFGDHLNLSLNRKDISNVDYRMNPHSLVGLGRWIAVEGIMDKHRVRLQIEPREKRTLLGNLIFSKVVKAHLKSWVNEKESRD